MPMSNLISDFARFTLEKRGGTQAARGMLAEIDAQRDEGNWTPAELDLIEDEVTALPDDMPISQLTVQGWATSSEALASSRWRALGADARASLGSPPVAFFLL